MIPRSEEGKTITNPNRGGSQASGPAVSMRSSSSAVTISTREQPLENQTFPPHSEPGSRCRIEDISDGSEIKGIECIRLTEQGRNPGCRSNALRDPARGRSEPIYSRYYLSSQNRLPTMNPSFLVSRKYSHPIFGASTLWMVNQLTR